jgi:hypothetical protein
MAIPVPVLPARSRITRFLGVCVLGVVLAAACDGGASRLGARGGAGAHVEFLSDRRAPLIVCRPAPRPDSHGSAGTKTGPYPRWRCVDLGHAPGSSFGNDRPIQLEEI